MMRPIQTLLLASACALTGIPALTPASAQPLHRHRYRHAAHRISGPDAAPSGYAAYPGDGFNAGAAQLPPRGSYDRYEGPGATVLRRGLAAQYEPGVTQELEPDAKQTATGGPSGGLPGRGGP